MDKSATITVIKNQAQDDWSNRSIDKQIYNEAVIAGIQIGYDRAIAAIKADALVNASIDFRETETTTKQRVARDDEAMRRMKLK